VKSFEPGSFYSVADAIFAFEFRIQNLGLFLYYFSSKLSLRSYLLHETTRFSQMITSYAESGGLGSAVPSDGNAMVAIIFCMEAAVTPLLRPRDTSSDDFSRAISHWNKSSGR
jgi:hypothetical protein